MTPSGSNQKPKSKKARWDRIVLKVSGEAFAGNAGFGIDGDIVGVIAEEIFQVRSEYEVDIAVVVGGGNIWRGMAGAGAGMVHKVANYPGCGAVRGHSDSGVVVAQGDRQSGCGAARGRSNSGCR